MLTVTPIVLWQDIYPTVELNAGNNVISTVDCSFGPPIKFVVASSTAFSSHSLVVTGLLQYITFSFAVGWRQEGHPACKKLDVGDDIWLELCTSFSSSCHHSPLPSSLAPIKQANPGSPGKMDFKTETEVYYNTCTANLDVCSIPVRLLWHIQVTE